ncbi:MAG: hypothetical protein FJ240_08995 [Nitrospira sp.]|nr:hypothetical protein [Nitrospira sp.]
MRQSLSFIIITLLLGFFVILGYSGVGLGIEKDIKSIAVEPIKSPSASECGALEIDKTTGGMKKKPNVDLVVTRIEIIRNDRGVWVKPWIKNICTGSITQDIHVSIGDVVVTFAGLTPQVASTIGYTVGVPSAASYTVIVDYDYRIPEANELNNRCTRSETGNCL